MTGETVVVGKSVVRTDAAAKVRGGATYGGDVRFGGMLVGKTLRAESTRPHREPGHFRGSQGAGVRAIVTGQDCTRRHGLFQKDQPALAIDRVRYAGEVVAAAWRRRTRTPPRGAIERIAVG
jgi:carbon-monoxide dehydrogenase large subunit